MNETEDLVVAAEAESTDPDELRTILDRLLAGWPGIGTAVALGLLAREPRVKPSRDLLIDPRNDAHRRWLRRVTAAAALLGSPSAADVRQELREEFTDDPDLEIEARARITGATGSLRPQ